MTSSSGGSASSDTPHVVVLGAGPAGLGAAWRLAVRGDCSVTVLEASRRVGGAAASTEVGGIRVDLGSHRLHPTCRTDIVDDIRGFLGDDLLQRPRNGRIHLGGRWVRFPLAAGDLVRSLPPATTARLAGDALRSLAGVGPRLRGGGEDDGAATYADELQRRFGPALCRELWFPYARKIWGLDPDGLSAVQAQRRVSARSLLDVGRRALRGTTGRGPWFWYPRRGFGQIAESYAGAALEAGASIRLSDAVRAVHVSDRRVHAVETGLGTRITADVCLSTLPISVLAEVTLRVPGFIQDMAAGLRSRAMVLAYLVLPVDRWTDFDAHYLPDGGTPISRVSEPKWYRAGGPPGGRTVICAEIPCDTTDATWDASDALLGRRVVADLRALGLVVPEPTEVRSIRLRHAYPVYDLGYPERFTALDGWAGSIGNLLTLGRQGLFVHDNTHHALEMGYEAADCIRSDGTIDRRRWADARRRFATHTVED